jgi:cell wall-associated NlpC family hydrolase
MKSIREILYKTTVAGSIGALLLMTSVVPVQAQDLYSQLNQSQQQADQINGVLNSQVNNVAAATKQMLALKQSVQVLNDGIAREQVFLSQEQQHLQELEVKQQKLEAQRQEHIKVLGQFLKGNYEDGVSTYIAVLLDSSSLSDFFDRIDKIKMIVTTYSKLQQDISVANQDINNQKSLISQRKSAISAAIQEKTQTQQAVKQALEKQQAVVDQLTATERATLNLSLNAQAKVSRIQQLIQQQEFEAENAARDKGAISRGSISYGVAGTVDVSGGAQQIVNYAEQFLGTPYVWGGTSPSGFDCSGFVQYVYRHFGISLSRTSEQQYYNGVYVPRSDLQPGDLVFFHTYSSDASHVGIYIGNNTMINSSNGGVSYDDMTNAYWAPRYLGARRVVAQ